MLCPCMPACSAGAFSTHQAGAICTSVQTALARSLLVWHWYKVDAVERKHIDPSTTTLTLLAAVSTVQGIIYPTSGTVSVAH